MSEDKPVDSFLYAIGDDLMRCDRYEWGHISTREGKIEKIALEGRKDDKG